MWQAVVEQRRTDAVRTCRFRALAVAPLLGMLSSLAAAEAASADQARLVAEGRDEYALHCAACHGESGGGDGPMAEILVLPPTDLTRIAANNDGSFPFWRVYRVYRVIAGQQLVSGHETFQMPLYWERFRGDNAKPGYLPAEVRILLLTHYLESIQL